MSAPATYTSLEGTADPTAPAAGSRILYAKSDGWYDRDDATISRIGAVNNYAATAAPGVGDDTADGYSVGSVWIDVTNDQFYMCVDSTAGAAVWHNVTGTLRASDGSPVALTANAAGNLAAAANITTVGGVHVGGTSDPGTDNLLVDGTTTLTGALTLTAGQLAFPATQNASADANTLDDYEEGTWTPVLAGFTLGAPQTYTATGSYTKIGRTVYINAVITGTGGTTIASVGGGASYITGIPFTEASKFSTAGFTDNVLLTPLDSGSVYQTAIYPYPWTARTAIRLSATYETT